MGNVVSKWISGNNQTFRARKRTFTAKFTHSEYNPKERYWLENQTFVQNPQIHREKTNERRCTVGLGRHPWFRRMEQNSETDVILSFFSIHSIFVHFASQIPCSCSWYKYPPLYRHHHHNPKHFRMIIRTCFTIQNKETHTKHHEHFKEAVHPPMALQYPPKWKPGNRPF